MREADEIRLRHMLDAARRSGPLQWKESLERTSAETDCWLWH